MYAKYSNQLSASTPRNKKYTNILIMHDGSGPVYRGIYATAEMKNNAFISR
jgi:hypothetical protein